ncbi:DUF2683 family protein [Pedobacter endophyticus]|uniref:Uncharacterized protein n=1 Tax=Pedobacter endophyticus TaxID=2789740 RepID=A0A7U3SPX7_9SPHI|nr:DUF2683 family protein [Pedobacter endophyticus]QPH38374.1 hypothetical protein IZT61_14930 [Pedobacter endophyticus]
METLIMHPKTKEQLAALKAVAKALKVPFKKEGSSALTEREKTIDHYGIEMVEAIEKAEESIKKGNVKTLDPTKSLWENIQSF